ncbi:MAG: hypothetical protein DI537_05130 [Stutzerimonas stutzeri]|nr:MAG: hypothetical protein DI537_05130 [Stutzerimonas stutzeri]
MIKRIAFATAAILSMSMAHAADLPYTNTYAPAAAPVASAPYSWTGFYIGGNLGAIGGTKNGAGFNGSSDGDFADGFVGNRINTSNKVGALFGPVIGYNYQISPSFVLGAEADYGWTNAENRASFSNTIEVFPGVAYYNVNAKTRTQLDSFGSVRGRIGYLVTPNLMLYGTGGLAFGSVKNSAHVVDTLAVPAGIATFSDVTAKSTKTKVGWTAGVGAEYALNRNWSVKAEYLYANLGKTNVSFPGAGLYNFTTKTRNEYQLFRAGLNYRF